MWRSEVHSRDIIHLDRCEFMIEVRQRKRAHRSMVGTNIIHNWRDSRHCFKQSGSQVRSEVVGRRSEVKVENREAADRDGYRETPDRSRTRSVRADAREQRASRSNGAAGRRA
jgi:hypothetical protein